MKKRLQPLTCSLCLVLLFAACAEVRLLEDIRDYENEIQALEARLQRNSSDVGAMQRLGEIYTWTGQYNRANGYLQQAFARNANDPKTHFYLGLVQEKLGDREAALRLYEKYPSAPRLSPYRRLLRGRYEWLSRNVARIEVAQRLASGDTLDADPRRVAVYQFAYLGTSEQYAPLGRGLGDLLTNDLSRVPGLVVVERVRLQELMKELELSQTGFVDPATSPRIGRLLGAGSVTGGTYNVLEGHTLDVSAAMVDTRTARPSEPQNRTAALSDFLQVEKDLVFALVEQMGIELTPEQRARIDYRPTENLQAFLAYSRGLLEEDAGNYRRAARHFREASRLDPNFNEAADRAEAMDFQTAAAGTIEEVIHSLHSPTPSADLLTNRITNLNSHITATIVPGQDARKPAQEPPRALPDPPRPPTSTGGN